MAKFPEPDSVEIVAGNVWKRGAETYGVPEVMHQPDG